MAIVSGRENNHSPTMGALANFAEQIRRLTTAVATAIQLMHCKRLTIDE